MQYKLQDVLQFCAIIAYIIFALAKNTKQSAITILKSNFIAELVDMLFIDFIKISIS